MPSVLEPTPVAELVSRLAGHVVATQQLLDRIHLEQVGEYLRGLDLSGIPRDEPLARSLIPTGLRMQSQTIEARIQVTRTVTRRYAVDLVLAGRVVTTFAEAVYGTKKSRADQITMYVAAMPFPNSPNSKKA